MAITAKYILTCDEVRQEANAKYIIIGLYTPDLTIPQIPFGLPSLTFFLALESDRPGNFQMRFALEHLDSGQKIVEGMGAVGFQRPGLGMVAIPLRNVNIPSAGTFVFSLTIEGQKDPITSSFNIILMPPQSQPGAPPGFPHMR
jgi:hypothetical protein